MTGPEAARFARGIAKVVGNMPSDVTLKQLAVMSALVQTINDANPATLRWLADREDGLQPREVGVGVDWRMHIAQGGVDPEALFESMVQGYLRLGDTDPNRAAATFDQVIDAVAREIGDDNGEAEDG